MIMAAHGTYPRQVGDTAGRSPPLVVVDDSSDKTA